MIECQELKRLEKDTREDVSTSESWRLYLLHMLSHGCVDDPFYEEGKE